MRDIRRTVRRLTALLAFAALAMVVWQSMLQARENNRHMNRDIFPVFRAIEAQCTAEMGGPTETVRCARALDVMKSCYRDAPDVCSAERYYEELERAGFDLPPFYESGYTPR